jgi:DNA repair protein RecO (recombination protein O)
VETTRAILLRCTRLSDTSLIVSWCTERYGRLKTVAKGARRPNSSFSGKLDLLFESEIHFVRSRRSELHALADVVLLKSFENREMRALELASYFVELIELTTEPEQPVPELYELLQRALRYIETGTPNKRALFHFEDELVRLLGVSRDARGSATVIGDIYRRLPSSRGKLIRSLGSK